MDQTGLTFVLSEDGLQSLTFCLDQATGLYYVPGEAPLALDEFGSVERCFMPAAGGFESFVLKKVLLSAGGTLQEEYLRLCAVINIPGTVTVVQPPVFSATHGYLLTEFVAGESLAVFLSRSSRGASTGSTPMDMQRRMHALQQLSVTLNEVHAVGIVHRQIRPANVVIGEGQDTLHLIGFGGAEASSTGKVKGARGTLAYMAPEQLLQYRNAKLSGHVPDGYGLDGCASDWFALGLVAYQFLTERFPFPELMTHQELEHFLMLDNCTQLEILAGSYQNWTVAGWADNDDPRWACLWDCTKDPALFAFVRHLLAPLPELRLQDMVSAAFMHQTYFDVACASLSEMPLPLAPHFTPAKPLAGGEAGVVLSNGITFVPVPGMPTVLWDPHNPIVDTITGTLYRCFITPDHLRMSPQGPHAYQVGPALMKATDLLNLQFLRLPLHYNGVNHARATTLACHLNQEAALLSNMCQHSAAASPAAHLHQDVQYSVLRLPAANAQLWPECLQRVMQARMKDGDSIHPHGMQRLAIRLLNVLQHAHLCNYAIGWLNPAVVFLAPEAFVADVSFGFLPGWGCSEECLGPVMSVVEFMAPETIRALQGCPCPDEPAVSPAADIFSLGALLKALMLGHSNGRATVLSTLQQEAWDFADSLMAGPIAQRPTAEQALCSPFLSPASVHRAEKEMQLLLPHFCWDQDLLPIMPLGFPSQQAEHGFAQSEIILVHNSWAITALHASAAPPDGSTAAMPEQANDAPATNATSLNTPANTGTNANASINANADNFQDVASSDASKGVAKVLPPAVQDGSATFPKGSAAPHKQIPQESRLKRLFTPAAALSSSSSLGSEEQSPTLSTRANTAAQAEQQAEMQQSTQPSSLQHGLTDVSGSTTGLRPHDELMSLQAFMDSRLCGGCVHAHGIQMLAKQFLNVLVDLHAQGCSVGVLHPEAIAILPAAHIAHFSFGIVESNDWAQAMGPVEHMAPETLRAVLNQPLSTSDSFASPAADMFSLGVLLKGLALGYLPFMYSKKRSCTLSPDRAVKRAKGIVKQHKQWQGCDGAAVKDLPMLAQQAVSFANSLMSLNPLARPSAEASLAHHFLSPEMMTEAEADMWHCLAGYCHQRDILPSLSKGSATTGAVPSAASVQAGIKEQSPASASSVDSAANTEAEQQHTETEPAPCSGLLTQPTAFAYSESQLGEQQWMDLFLEACLGTKAQEMQPDHHAAQNVAPTDSPSSSEQQPAEAQLGGLEVPAGAGSLQRWMSRDCADDEEALWADAWLTAFTQAHLYTSLSSMQHADMDQASEGSDADHADTDSEEQSVALSDHEANDFDGDSEADSDSYQESDADCADEEYSDSDPLAVESQLYIALGSRLHISASSAIGWGYRAAGAAYGSFLGLKQGLRL